MKSDALVSQPRLFGVQTPGRRKETPLSGGRSLQATGFTGRGSFFPFYFPTDQSVQETAGPTHKRCDETKKRSED